MGVLRNEFESLAAIVRAVKRSVFRFEKCVNDVWITRRDANADAPDQFWQAIRQLGPGTTTVYRFVNAALFAAAAMRPGLALKTPHACVKNVWIRRIDLEV